MKWEQLSTLNDWEFFGPNTDTQEQKVADEHHPVGNGVFCLLLKF